MNIYKTQNGDKVILSLSGRLDANTASKLQETLMSELDNAKYVELDLAELVYISSAGLRVLLIGEKTAKAKGVRQTLINVLPQVMEVFEVTGISSILNIE